jgi:hypothetical protein
MFHRMGQFISSSVVAYTVLFVVLAGGTAYAAKRYLVTSTAQIKPSVRKALRGAQGRAGSAGATGATGATGSPGPVSSVLPSGRTETGAYDASGTATVVGDLASASISFPVPLASAPTPNIITSGATANCPGSVTAPAASAGELCIYVGVQVNVGQTAAYSPFTDDGGAASPYGAGLVIDSAGAGNFVSTGSWAVMAP